MTAPPSSSVRGVNGAVASADQLATNAGIAVLSSGGNAVDAAIATNAVMAVVAPHLCGMGGDLFALVYDPAGRPQLTSPARQQIGYFRPTGNVETGANRVANNVTLLAESIVLNYMALHDDVGRFASVLPGHGLGSGAQLDSLIAFQPIRGPGA